MDLSKITSEEARAIVLKAQGVFDASIADQQRTSPKEIQQLPLDLTVARTRSNAMKVSFPFKSVLIEQATDLNTYVYVVPISNDTGNDPIRLGLKDVYKNEFGFRECYIYWDAQPNKFMIIKFFVRSNIENGRLVVDSNTNNNAISMGTVASSDNGFTYLYTGFGGVTPAGTLMSLNFTYPDNKFFDTFNSGNNGLIKVPKGYIAKILAQEFFINSAVTVTTGTGVGLVIRVTNNGEVTGETGQLYLMTSSGGLTAGITSNTPHLVDALNGNSQSKTNVVDENQWIYIQKSSGQGVTAGGFTFKLLVRFEPKVGV